MEADGMRHLRRRPFAASIDPPDNFEIADAYKSAFSGIAWVSTGRVLSAIIGFLTTALIIRTLRPEEYGFASLIIAFSSLLSIIGDFGISHSIPTKMSSAIARGNNSEARKIFTLAIASTLTIGLVIAITVYNLAGSEILPEFSIYSHYLNAGLILMILTSLRTLSISSVASLQSFRLLAALRLVGVSTRLVTFLLFSNLRVIALIMSVSTHNAIISVIGILYSFTRIGVNEGDVSSTYSWKTGLRELLSFSLPLYLHDLFKSVRTRLAIFLLAGIGGLEQLGYFKAALELSIPFLSTIASSSNTTLIPVLSARHARRDHSTFRRIIQTFLELELILTVPMTFGLILVMRPFLSLFFPQYLNAILFFWILSTRIPIAAARNLFNPIATLSLSRPNTRLRISMINTSLYILLSLLLIPWIGILGAVILETTTNLTGMLVSYFYVRKNSGDPPSTVFFLKLLAACVVMSIVVYPISRILTGIPALIIGISTGASIFTLVFLRIGGLREDRIDAMERLFKSNPYVRLLILVIRRISGFSSLSHM
jgi:O-antigen/teichoic acid export membrane protein